MGLVDEEVTVAEDSCRKRAIIRACSESGTWVTILDMTPIEQGFDEAVWSEGNPPWWGFNRNVKRTDNAGYTDMGGMVWSPAPENFAYDTGGIMSGKKGQKSRRWLRPSPWNSTTPWILT